MTAIAATVSRSLGTARRGTSTTPVRVNATGGVERAEGFVKANER